MANFRKQKNVIPGMPTLLYHFKLPNDQLVREVLLRWVFLVNNVLILIIDEFIMIE